LVATASESRLIRPSVYPLEGAVSWLEGCIERGSQEEATMRKRRSVVVAAGALIAMPLMGAPACSAACVSGPVDVDTAPSFSCNVGVFEFSNINVSADGAVTFNTIAPFFPVTGELGLSLNMQAADDGRPKDAFWSYTVSSPALPAADALLQTDS